MNRLLLLLFVVVSLPALGQVPTDGLLMPTKTLCTGFMYQHDSWNQYWEGTLLRDNQNIGKLTTQNVMWYGVYGLTDKINLMASVPYVATNASKGTLHGMNGLQDLMLSAKYKLLQVNQGPGRFFAFVAGTFSTPLSNYTPDLLPLSIGLGSTNIGGRMNLNYTHNIGIYLNTSFGYTWRSNVFLDRPAYYTDGHLYNTNEVRMPNALDYKIDLGYHKGPVQAEVSYSQMNTLGGGDIRRQDMPFVSNRMNAGRLSGLVMYYLPWPKNFAVRGMVTETLAGRNVGKTTSIMGGILYTFYFNKEKQQAATEK